MKFWPIKKKSRIFADAAAGLGNPSSLHTEGVEAKKELEDARARIAAAVGAHPDEIIFTSGGTEANNLAIFGAMRRVLREKGSAHAITTVIEHPSVLEPLRALKKEGLKLTELPVDEQGQIDIKTLREAITEETVFVSVQMVNSEIGTIQNIREIAKAVRHMKRRHTAPARALRGASPSPTLASSGMTPFLHTDASQAPLWLPLKVESLGVDIMTLDAQKIMGPKSIGVLYVKRGTNIEPIILGGGQEGGLRSGTENAILAKEFADVLEAAQKNVVTRAQATAEVRDFLIEEIKKRIPDVVVNGPSITLGTTLRVANNINISIPNLDGQMATIAMDREGIAISTRSACSSEEEELSYVLLAVGATPEQAKDTIRITLMPDATESDAKKIAATLDDVWKRYRK